MVADDPDDQPDETSLVGRTVQLVVVGVLAGNRAGMCRDFVEDIQVGVATPGQNKITRCGLGVGAPAENMYVGWYYRFLVLFGVLALVVIVGASLDDSLSTVQTAIVVGTVISMAAWFWFYGRWHIITSDTH